MTIDLIPLDSPRLRRLLNAREHLDAEIARERQAVRRARELDRIVTAAMRRDVGDENMTIIRQVGDYCGVTPAQIIGKAGQGRVLHDARRLSAALMREQAMSYPQIGRALGRHHTTAMQWCGEVGTNPTLFEMLADVRRRVWGDEAVA